MFPMTTQFRLLLASLSLSAVLVAHAETPAGPAAVNRTVSPILAVLDSNRDGALSKSEIAAAPRVLTALDRNDDGLISTDERLADAAGGRSVRFTRGATAFNIVFTLDANQDGDLQPLEIANAVSSLKRLDLNRDGELSAQELRPVMVARHGM